MDRKRDSVLAYAVWGGVGVALIALYRIDAVWGDVGLASVVLGWGTVSRLAARPWEPWAPNPSVTPSGSGVPRAGLAVAMGCTIPLALFGAGFANAMHEHLWRHLALLVALLACVGFAWFASYATFARGKLTPGSASFRARYGLVSEAERFGIHRAGAVQWWPLSEIVEVRMSTGLRPNQHVTVWDRDGRRGRWRVGALLSRDVEGVREAVLPDLVRRLVARIERGEAIAIGSAWPGATVFAALLLGFIACAYFAPSVGPPSSRFSVLVAWVTLLVLPTRARGYWLPRGCYLSRDGIRAIGGSDELPWEDALAVRVGLPHIEVLAESRTVRVGAGLGNAPALPGIAAAMRARLAARATP